jgi:hypothetical protein
MMLAIGLAAFWALGFAAGFWAGGRKVKEAARMLWDREHQLITGEIRELGALVQRELRKKLR